MNDYDKMMKEQIYNMEVSIAEWLKRGFEPSMLIGNPRAIDMILEYLKLEVDSINWREPVFIIIAEMQIRVIRSLDIAVGELYIK